MTQSSTQVNFAAIVHYLIELRSRLIRSLFILIIFFAVFSYYANTLYSWLAAPLLRFLPQGHLIATEIVSPFFVPFKVAFLAAFLLTIPFLLYQLWAFVAPALYGHERKLVWPFLLVSTCLFYAGIAFAYFVIFPMLFHFLSHVAPQGVVVSPDISEYFDFTTKLLLIFGALFEIPIIMVLLTSTGLVTRERFVKWRSYAIVGAFILGMLLAPPDVMSQTILAIPIWLLYELGLLMSRFIGKANRKPDEQKIK